MSSSIAQRRGAKAARRKKLLAERRRHADAGGSLASRVQRLALAPIHRCLLQDGLFESGMGTLLLARGTPSAGFTMATFLLDVFCLGVKDVVFRQVESSELDEIVEVMAVGVPFAAVEPSYARKLLRDLVAYARSIGLEPAREYKTAELLFGDVSTDACDSRFEFGCDGRPLYVPGPGETPAQVRQRLERLRRSVGEDGFDFSEFGGEEDDDEADPAFSEDEEEDGLFEGYDPAVAPDPSDWLALDEQERILRVEHYHRRAGIRTGNDTVHATMHTIVENQIAASDPPQVGPTVQRLTAEGLDRHEAVHAVSSLIADFFFDVTHGETAPFVVEEYVAAMERLTPENWRRLLEEAEASAEEP